MPDIDISSVNAMTLPGQTYVPAGPKKADGENSHVSQDTFLKLLVAQLQHQDPLEPQQNSEFIAQLAQFQSLEGQLKSNDTLGRIANIQESQLALQGLAQAATLIGADVTWVDPYDGVEYHGVIDRIAVENGVTVAHIGDARVPVGMLTSVSRAAAASTAPPPTSAAQKSPPPAGAVDVPPGTTPAPPPVAPPVIVAPPTFIPQFSNSVGAKFATDSF